VLMGTNDLGDKCSSEAIAAGNMRIVEEIQNRRPNAIIVLNSILPRGIGGEDILSSNKNSVWPRIQRINEWMKCYADSTDGVDFFNATSFFLKDNETVLVKEYFIDGLHPSAAGAAVWGKAIVEKVQELTD
jgi:lysophospholipase L1-like esterase